MRAFLPVQLALCGGLLITGCNPNQTPSVDSNNASLLDTYAAPDSSDISSVVPPATETLSNATQSDTDIFDATQSASDISDATQPAPDISDATQSASDISDATQPASSSFDIAQFSSDLADATQPSNDINDGTQFAKDLSDGEQEGEEVYLPKDVVEGDVAIFGEPVANVDVLVIGAGPAGLSAAWEARLAGASVVILEMGEKAGGGGSYAYTFFAAGSPWQEQEGYPNSFEETVAAWPSITGGGDATDPLVSKFLLHSSETLLWLVNDVGAEVAGVVPCIGECATPTSHMVMSKGKGAVGLLVDSL